MFSNIQINTAEDLVKGLAIAVQDKRLSLSEIHDFILECTDGDERLTTVVLEKTLVQLECLKYSVFAAADAVFV